MSYKDVSTFMVTFVIEVQGLEVWHDCGEDWLDLDSPVQGLKLSYILYPGFTYDVDILIWPHVAKVWCRNSAAWVRTWLHLGKRWLACSIRHALRLNITQFRDQTVTFTVGSGLSAVSPQARNDKNTEVFIPALVRGERRQFANVMENLEGYSLKRYIKDLIWGLVEGHIPSSILDGEFDVPQIVTAISHQDAVLREVQNISMRKELVPQFTPPMVDSKTNTKSKTKDLKGKNSQEPKLQGKGQAKSQPYEIRFAGDAICAGVRGVVTGQHVGEKTPEQGEVIVLLSSCNLPPPTENPVFFVNSVKLYDMPVDALTSAGFNQIYTRWKIPDEEHTSQAWPIEKVINLNDPRAVPMEPKHAAELIASFQEKLLEIEIRGIRNEVSEIKVASFFGYDPSDRDFGQAAVPTRPRPLASDALIAICRIDLQALVKSNGIVHGSFPVLPPSVKTYVSARKTFCTNEINGIRIPKTPEPEISTSVILEAMPTLTIIVGFVGCRPAPISVSFSRLICAPRDPETTGAILEEIYRANHEVVTDETPDEILTGWAVDLGTSAVIFVEGSSTGRLLSVWSKVLNYENLDAAYSSVARYPTRFYADLLTAVPFLLLKLHAPLNVLLACPPIYARPALPLPARTALLKLGRIVMCGVDQVGPGDNLPTANELQSLRLELCAPPRPPVRKLNVLSDEQDKPQIRQSNASCVTYE